MGTLLEDPFKTNWREGLSCIPSQFFSTALDPRAWTIVVFWKENSGRQPQLITFENEALCKVHHHPALPFDIDTNDSLNVPAHNKSPDRSKQITITSVRRHPSQTETDHVNQEQKQSYTVEQIVDVPVPQIRKETDEVTQFIPQDEISDHVFEQTVDIPSAQIQEQAVESARIIPQDRLQQHTTEETVIVHMIMRVRDPAVQAMMKTFEVPQVQFVDRSETIQPVEQNSSCDVEKIKDVNVPSVMKEVFEVVKHFPHKRRLNRTGGNVDSVCHESSRTLNDTDFNGTQDVCMSAQENTGAESVNRCSHDKCSHEDIDDIGHRPTDQDKKGRHMHTRIRDVCAQARQQVVDARREKRRYGKQESLRQRSRKDDRDHSRRAGEGDRW